MGFSATGVSKGKLDAYLLLNTTKLMYQSIGHSRSTTNPVTYNVVEARSSFSKILCPVWQMDKATLIYAGTSSNSLDLFQFSAKNVRNWRNYCQKMRFRGKWPYMEVGIIAPSFEAFCSATRHFSIFLPSATCLQLERLISRLSEWQFLEIYWKNMLV